MRRRRMSEQARLGAGRHGGEPHVTVPDENDTRLEERERWASAVGGAALTLAGFARRGPVGLLLAAVGAYGVYRGATGRCPASRVLRDAGLLGELDALLRPHASRRGEAMSSGTLEERAPEPPREVSLEASVDDARRPPRSNGHSRP
jgi:hypothetical protein